MLYVWNQQFESYPPGSYRGNTMGKALRRMKAAFYERFIVEHEISEGESPTVIHKLGECGIVQIVEDDETPSSNYVSGSLQYQNGILYYDDGSELHEDNFELEHDLLNGLDDDDHPQYIKVSGDTATGSLRVDGVSGLPTDPTNYTAATPDRVLSIGAHKALDGNDINNHHSDDIYTTSIIDSLTSTETFRLSSTSMLGFNDRTIDNGTVGLFYAPDPIMAGEGRIYSFPSWSEAEDLKGDEYCTFESALEPGLALEFYGGHDKLTNLGEFHYKRYD